MFEEKPYSPQQPDQRDSMENVLDNQFAHMETPNTHGVL